MAGCGKAVVGPLSISPAVITVGVSSIYNRGRFAPWPCDVREIMWPWRVMSSRLSLHHAAWEPQCSSELFCTMARIKATGLQHSAAPGGIPPGICPHIPWISARIPPNNRLYKLHKANFSHIFVHTSNHLSSAIFPTFSQKAECKSTQMLQKCYSGSEKT